VHAQCPNQGRCVHHRNCAYTVFTKGIQTEDPSIRCPLGSPILTYKSSIRSPNFTYKSSIRSPNLTYRSLIRSPNLTYRSLIRSALYVMAGPVSIICPSPNPAYMGWIRCTTMHASSDPSLQSPSSNHACDLHDLHDQAAK
jgi:hypothetical protein